MNRRHFLQSASLAFAYSPPLRASPGRPESSIAPATHKTPDLTGFEKMKVGVSFHFGMGTFTGNDYDEGTAPAAMYAATALNVDQWLASAESIGARYAILTAKHMSGFCLWAADNYDYDIAVSSNHTDVVAAFTAACRKRNMLPGFYYCILDPRNEHNQGHPDWNGQISPTYFDLVLRQIRELHRKNRPIGVQLIDIPGKLSADERWEIYRAVKELDPHCLMMVNQTWRPSQTNRGRICIPDAWPTDLMLSEDAVPPPQGHNDLIEFQGIRYYMPMVSWIPAGPFYRGNKYRQWFWSPEYKIRPAPELFELYRETTTRNGSFMLNLSPDSRGLLSDDQVDCMHRLGDLIRKSA